MAIKKIYNLKVFIAILTVAAIIILFQSCRGECGFKPVSLAGVNFHSVVNGIDSHVAVDSLTVHGVGREDSLLYAGRGIRTINLPLNGSANETGFVVIFQFTADTVWLTHEVIPWFMSQECGFILNFELTGARHSSALIDSVVIVTKEITSFDETNIRIYY
jgi:hypothetical protein